MSPLNKDNRASVFPVHDNLSKIPRIAADIQMLQSPTPRERGKEKEKLGAVFIRLRSRIIAVFVSTEAFHHQ